MQAHLGDQLVVGCPTTGTTRRDGEVVGLHHEDGTPPYDVRWSDTDQIWLFFPGPGTLVRHTDCLSGAAPPRTATPAEV
ncbi:DUF1918 domain-containing protein [Streptomyces sp. NPDC059122]|uniref:DUF1918 domain-containing protein n=1 Tax=unclassified Streptomyces TaxID=2593676 RepID=UPI003697D9C9